MYGNTLILQKEKSRNNIIKAISLIEKYQLQVVNEL